jgi:hypothetical protein
VEVFKESASQKEKFRIAANKLLNQCFILKKKDSTKNDYMFVVQNKEYFQEYFDLLGYQVKINQDQGVIGITNVFGIGRLQLSKYESILLLIFRLLYIEKRKEIGSMNQEVVVLMEEIHDKYNMLKLKTKPIMDKGMVKHGIGLLKRYNIIMNLDSDVTLQEARIIIYPSVIMAMSIENINILYDDINSKLSNYAGGETVDDDDEEEEITD